MDHCDEVTDNYCGIHFEITNCWDCFQTRWTLLAYELPFLYEVGTLLQGWDNGPSLKFSVNIFFEVVFRHLIPTA